MIRSFVSSFMIIWSLSFWNYTSTIHTGPNIWKKMIGTKKTSRISPVILISLTSSGDLLPFVQGLSNESTGGFNTWFLKPMVPKKMQADQGWIHLTLTDGPSIKCFIYKCFIFFVRFWQNLVTFTGWSVRLKTGEFCPRVFAESKVISELMLWTI